MRDLIIWAAPDGSWGGCRRDDLLVVPESAISAADLAEIERLADLEHHSSIYEVLANMLPLAPRP